MAALKLKITLTLLILLAFALPVPALAQQTLPFNLPTSGTVPPNGVQTWTFSAQSGAVLSFVATAASPDFDAALTLSDSSGRALISSDDYNYPDRLDPLLEAVTMPRADTYTLTVSGVNGTSGDYVLTMLPGYSVLDYSDDFSSTSWQALTPTLVRSDQNDERLSLSINGIRASGVAFDAQSDPVADFYAQADVVSVSNPTGWVVGLALRRQGDRYYLLSINSQGYWRFTLVNGGDEQVIRDWTLHPNVIPGQTTFTLSVLAKSVGFDFFYNSGYIGSVSDNALTEAGQIGLMIGTTAASTGTTDATFDNLIVTTPAQINGADLIPQQVMSGDGRTIVQALKRSGMVSADGEMALTLDQSSVQYAHPGVNRVMLGRGTQYTNFAIGATVDVAPAAPGPAGCGIVFRYTGEQDYTLAYVDQAGGYGVSVRTADGFLPGLEGINPLLGAGQHFLLLIANEGDVYYYIDRQLVGSVANSPVDGEVGIAAINFELNSTTCTYSNLWLWKWG